MEIKEAYKFCPRCGAKFSKKPSHLKCPTCGLSYYFNPKPTSSVILINDKDEILFAVRALDPKKGFLDFPGGFAEENESFEESARRELKEELGIKVGKLTYLSSHTGDYLFDDVNYKVLGVAYLARLPKNASIKPKDDVASVEFYKIDDVPVDRLSDKAMVEMLDILRTKLA